MKIDKLDLSMLDNHEIDAKITCNYKIRYDGYRLAPPTLQKIVSRYIPCNHPANLTTNTINCHAVYIRTNRTWGTVVGNL